MSDKRITSPSGRRNFFERMEREIDFDNEFYKIEALMRNGGDYGYSNSMEYQIDRCFLRWKLRDTFTSYDELRSSIGFPKMSRYGERYELEHSLELEDYLAYCEMILNLIMFITKEDEKLAEEIVVATIHTIGRNIQKLGMCLREMEDGRILAVQISPEANSVADITSQSIADVVVEYNHYLLKGNLAKKRSLLIVLADDLESKRRELNAAKFTGVSDLFFLFNNMNIRHNNIDPNGANYKPRVAAMSKEELEKWYDETYQLALMAYLYLENVERVNKIATLKQELGSGR